MALNLPHYVYSSYTERDAIVEHHNQHTPLAQLREMHFESSSCGSIRSGSPALPSMFADAENLPEMDLNDEDGYKITLFDNSGKRGHSARGSAHVASYRDMTIGSSHSLLTFDDRGGSPVPSFASSGIGFVAAIAFSDDSDGHIALFDDTERKRSVADTSRVPSRFWSMRDEVESMDLNSSGPSLPPSRPPSPVGWRRSFSPDHHLRRQLGPRHIRFDSRVRTFARTSALEDLLLDPLQELQLELVDSTRVSRNRGLSRLENLVRLQVVIIQFSSLSYNITAGTRPSG